MFGAWHASDRPQGRPRAHRDSSLGSDRPERLAAELKGVAREALAELKRDGLKGAPALAGYLSMRYLGQNFGELIKLSSLEMNQAIFDHAVEDMHTRHEELYGYSMRDRVVEVTEVRVVALGEEAVSAQLLAPAGGKAERHAMRAIYFTGAGSLDTPIYRRDELPEGTRLEGPALIEEMDSTTLLHPGDSTEVRADGSLIIQVGAATGAASNRQAPAATRITPEARPDDPYRSQQRAAQHLRRDGQRDGPHGLFAHLQRIARFLVPVVRPQLA